MLNWSDQFNICCFLDSHEYSVEPHSFECILAAGAKEVFTADNSGRAFEDLKHFCKTKKEWLFGHFSYDCKNELEVLESTHPDHLAFPDIFFFIPETVIILDKQAMHIFSEDALAAHSIFQAIAAQEFTVPQSCSGFNIKSRFSRAEYIEVIQQLKEHILKGDCYEINFCQEFYQEDVTLQPLSTYLQLSTISPNPFAAYYKVGGKYLLCVSPERYLYKKGGLLIAQPMKGTSKRNLEFSEEDEKGREDLRRNPKEQSENVMVVDLVRNDLSKVCVEGSVKVEALYAVYSFPQTHQMISTISGKVNDTLDWTECIKATFPMGSMTGAPKKRVMELVEQYERSRRGLFSGAIGYLTPEKDFDFNVVIRSILYNATNKYLSYQVGSAITFYSDPEKEYEECLLKAAAIKKVLT